MAEAADGQVGCQAPVAEAEEHARLLEEAEQKAVEDTEKDQGNDLAMEVTGSLAEVRRCGPRELKWPVTDVFVADAMSDYVEVLESAVPDKQLKRYHNYMRDPPCLGRRSRKRQPSGWHARLRRQRPFEELPLGLAWQRRSKRCSPSPCKVASGHGGEY